MLAPPHCITGYNPYIERFYPDILGRLLAGRNSRGRGGRGEGRGAFLGSATQPDLLDDFERTDPIDEYSGGTGDGWTGSTNQAFSGSRSMLMPQGTTDNSVIQRNDPTISQGIRFTAHAYMDADTDVAFTFAVQDISVSNRTDNNYDAYIVQGDADDPCRIKIRENGNRNVLREGDAPAFPAQEWILWEVTWETDGTIQFRLEDEGGSELVNISTVDNTFTSGGWGMMKVGGNADIYHDLLEATSL